MIKFPELNISGNVMQPRVKRKDKTGKAVQNALVPQKQQQKSFFRAETSSQKCKEINKELRSSNG